MFVQMFFVVNFESFELSLIKGLECESSENIMKGFISYYSDVKILIVGYYIVLVF